MKKLRVVNVYKFIRSVVVLLLFIITLIVLSSKASFSHTDKQMLDYTTINVIYGDTIWDIASSQQENNPYYEGKDVRYIVYDIKQINSLQTGNLVVGQELKIPII